MRRLLIQCQAQKERCAFNNTDIIYGGVSQTPIDGQSPQIISGRKCGIAIGGHLIPDGDQVLHPSDGSLELITTV